MISEEQLKEWERLASKATEGPWYAYEGRDYSEIHERTATHARPLVIVGSQHKDAEFIGAAREAVPALIARVRQLEKDLDGMAHEHTALELENAQLEKEAVWLASHWLRCPWPDAKGSVGTTESDQNECIKCWREAARKEVRE